MSLDGTLDRLAYLVRGASGVPLSASCVVNRVELLALIEQARAELPAEVEESRRVLERRAEVLQAAERQAQTMLKDAERRAGELVATSAVTFRAQAQAQEIVEAAREGARQARWEADDWCDRRMAAVEAEIERALNGLRRGRAVLEERLGADREPATPVSPVEGSAEHDHPSAEQDHATVELGDPPVELGHPTAEQDHATVERDHVIDLRDGRRPGRWSRPG